MFQSCCFFKGLCSSFSSFRKEIGLDIRGPVEDESGRCEADTSQLGGRMQGLCGKNRLWIWSKNWHPSMQHRAPKQNSDPRLRCTVDLIRDKMTLRLEWPGIAPSMVSYFCFDITPQTWLLEFVSKTVSISGLLHLQCTETWKFLSPNFLLRTI